MTCELDDKMGPVLEMWTDEDRSPAVVRLVGTLDHSTNGAFLALVSDLFSGGVQQLVVDVTGADIVASGATSLCQRLARENGGSLLWDGVSMKPSAAERPQHLSRPSA